MFVVSVSIVIFSFVDSTESLCFSRNFVIFFIGKVCWPQDVSYLNVSCQRDLFFSANSYWRTEQIGTAECSLLCCEDCYYRNGFVLAFSKTIFRLVWMFRFMGQD